MSHRTVYRRTVYRRTVYRRTVSQRPGPAPIALLALLAAALSGCAGNAPPMSPGMTNDAAVADPYGATGEPTPETPGDLPSPTADPAPPSPGELCAPCTSDADCGGPDDRCMAYGEGGFCGRACVETFGECPVDYRCRRERTVSGQRALQCYHLGDTCGGAILGGTQGDNEPSDPPPQTPPPPPATPDDPDGGAAPPPTDAGLDDQGADAAVDATVPQPPPSSTCDAWSSWSCNPGHAMYRCTASCGAQQLTCLNSGDCVCGVSGSTCGKYAVTVDPCETCRAALEGGCCD